MISKEKSLCEYGNGIFFLGGGSVNEAPTVRLVAKPTVLLPSGALFFFIFYIFVNSETNVTKMVFFKKNQQSGGLYALKHPLGK